MGYRIEVTASGALFDGRAAPVIQRALEEMQQDVGSQGLANWHANLDTSIRHPTPYYETQITVQRVASDVVVHDRGVIYGAWLEGLGSRNSPVTRFPGYFSLRRAFQTLKTQAGPLIERVLRRYLEELNR